MRKYTLDKTRMWRRGNHILYQIRYSDGFKRYIKKTQNVDIEGGWLESEDNLSQEGECYVTGDGAVYDGASILGTAIVCDHATVRGPESVFEDAICDGDDYIVDSLSQVEFDEDTDAVFTPADDYDEMEIPDFHKNELSPEEIEARQKREEQFRREFDWDSIHAETYGYSSDELADEDFVDDFEEDDNI